MTSSCGSRVIARACVLLSICVLVAMSARAGQRGIGGATTNALKNPVKASPESIAAGKQTFTKYCAFCHGPEAKGDGPMAPKDTHPPNLTDTTWLHGSSDGEIFTNIHDGIGPKFDMKPNKDKLKDEEIWNVVNYLRSIGAGKR